MDKGELVYEYNMMEIDRTRPLASERLPPANTRSRSTRRSRKPRRCGRDRPESRWQGSRRGTRQADGAGGRLPPARASMSASTSAHRCRPTISTGAVQVRRQDRQAGGQAQVTAHLRPKGLSRRSEKKRRPRVHRSALGTVFLRAPVRARAIAPRWLNRAGKGLYWPGSTRLPSAIAPARYSWADIS